MAKGYKEAVERDRGTCRGCGRAYTQVHHITFRSQGGSDEADNLVCLCDRCHNRAHGLIAGEGLSEIMLRAIVQTSGNIDHLYMRFAICYTCWHSKRDTLGRYVCGLHGFEITPLNYCEDYQRRVSKPESW